MRTATTRRLWLFKKRSEPATEERQRQTILITGASSGIGKATAKHFQAKSWNVIATVPSLQKEQGLTQLDNVLVARGRLTGGF